MAVERLPETSEPTPADEDEARRLPRQKNQAAIDLLDSWLGETDPEVIREQQETWEHLRTTLDEDRLSPGRKLSPVSAIILLDRGPLAQRTNPRATPENERAALWRRGLSATRTRVILPEIADHRFAGAEQFASDLTGLRQMDALELVLEDAPPTTEAMPPAAAFWAGARRRGRPLADRHALDGDVIPAAQATRAARQGDPPLVATTNPAHPSRFVAIGHRREIPGGEASPPFVEREER